MGFGTPKGMSDLWNEDVEKRKFVYQRIEKVLYSYGFAFIEPSPVEYLETLIAKSGPEIEKEIYSFEDKKGEKLALRFDLTVGMARMMASKQLPLPARFANIGCVWRYDNPQHGRYRWFWQWDAETFGSPSIDADAESISLTCDILKSCGLKDFFIRINSRKLLEAFLLSIGIDKSNTVKVMRILDKHSKLSEAEFKIELKKCGLSHDQITGIGKHMGMVGTVVNDENENLGERGANEVSDVLSILEGYGNKSLCHFDPSIVRGFDYYTGIVFEAIAKGEESLGSIAGGGRFDNLVGVYGKTLPAVGVAGGIERLLLSLEQHGVLKKPSSRPVMIISVKDSARKGAIEIAQSLRASGVRAVVDVQGRDLRGQLEYANKAGMAKTVILGPKELDEGKATIKDMESGKEEKVPLKDVAKKLV